MERLVLTLSPDQIRNPVLMDPLEGSHCPNCGYECSAYHPTPADRRHWCLFRRIAVGVLRWTNRGRLGVIELTDAELQPGLTQRHRMLAREEGVRVVRSRPTPRRQKSPQREQ